MFNNIDKVNKINHITQKDINNLFNNSKYNISKFNIFQGEYPEKYPNISKLDDNIINMLKNNVIPDKAKSTNNRERKDHDSTLINLNEKEKELLVSGFFSFPKKEIKFNKNKIVLTREFVLNINADAIVNTANEVLLGGGGMDLLIHTYAGDSLKEETSSLPNVIDNNYYYGVKCLTGNAKITSAHNLPYKYIIHTVTPYLDSNGNTDKINHINSYKSVLNYIDGKNIRSIIIGPISTGYYGYPMLEAAILGLNTIIDFMNNYEKNVDNIYLWIYNDTQYEIFNYLLNNI